MKLWLSLVSSGKSSSSSSNRSCLTWKPEEPDVSEETQACRLTSELLYLLPQHLVVLFQQGSVVLQLLPLLPQQLHLLSQPRLSGSGQLHRTQMLQ